MSTPKAPEEAPGADAQVVHTRALGRRFGRRWAVSHFDIDIAAGEQVVMAGANGSGKTTLLRMLCGLCQPSCGVLRVAGREPTQARSRVREGVTLVSHQTYLYEGLSAAETVSLWQQCAGGGGDRQGRSVNDLLESVRLADAADQPVATFSQGMRKRLSLLRAEIEDPDLVLLDEPFAALDPAGQSLIGEWISAFGARGKTVVFASHALDHARSLATRAILLHRGQLAWDGEARNLPDPREFEGSACREP